MFILSVYCAHNFNTLFHACQGFLSGFVCIFTIRIRFFRSVPHYFFDIFLKNRIFGDFYEFFKRNEKKPHRLRLFNTKNDSIEAFTLNNVIASMTYFHMPSLSGKVATSVAELTEEVCRLLVLRTLCVLRRLLGCDDIIRFYALSYIRLRRSVPPLNRRQDISLRLRRF